jgi:hypothetical protein
VKAAVVLICKSDAARLLCLLSEISIQKKNLAARFKERLPHALNESHSLYIKHTQPVCRDHTSNFETTRSFDEDNTPNPKTLKSMAF